MFKHCFAHSSAMWWKSDWAQRHHPLPWLPRAVSEQPQLCVEDISPRGSRNPGTELAAWYRKEKTQHLVHIEAVCWEAKMGWMCNSLESDIHLHCSCHTVGNIPMDFCLLEALTMRNTWNYVAVLLQQNNCGIWGKYLYIPGLCNLESIVSYTKEEQLAQHASAALFCQQSYSSMIIQLELCCSLSPGKWALQVLCGPYHFSAESPACWRMERIKPNIRDQSLDYVPIQHMCTSPYRRCLTTRYTGISWCREDGCFNRFILINRGFLSSFHLFTRVLFPSAFISLSCVWPEDLQVDSSSSAILCFSHQLYCNISSVLLDYSSAFLQE